MKQQQKQSCGDIFSNPKINPHSAIQNHRQVPQKRRKGPKINEFNKQGFKEYLKQSHSICDIVSHPPLTRNPNLILVNRCLGSWLLDPLVPIHLAQKTTNGNQNNNSTQELAYTKKTYNIHGYTKISNNENKLGKDIETRVSEERREEEFWTDQGSFVPSSSKRQNYTLHEGQPSSLASYLRLRPNRLQ